MGGLAFASATITGSATDNGVVAITRIACAAQVEMAKLCGDCGTGSGAGSGTGDGTGSGTVESTTIASPTTVSFAAAASTT